MRALVRHQLSIQKLDVDANAGVPRNTCRREAEVPIALPLPEDFNFIP